MPDDSHSIHPPPIGVGAANHITPSEGVPCVLRLRDEIGVRMGQLFVVVNLAKFMCSSVGSRKAKQR
jgi:hypothetical protein